MQWRKLKMRYDEYALTAAIIELAVRYDHYRHKWITALLRADG